MTPREPAIQSGGEPEHFDDTTFEHLVGHLDDVIGFLDAAPYEFVSAQRTVLFNCKRLRASILRALDNG
jgi:hypothetical protein